MLKVILKGSDAKGNEHKTKRWLLNGDAVRKRIHKIGMTQRDFAKEIGTSEPTLSRALNQKQVVSIELVKKIASASMWDVENVGQEVEVYLEETINYNEFEATAANHAYNELNEQYHVLDKALQGAQEEIEWKTSEAKYFKSFKEEFEAKPIRTAINVLVGKFEKNFR